MASSTRRSIKDVQQDLAQNCGFGTDIIWDILAPDTSDVLKKKIEQLLPNQEKGQKRIIELRDAIFTNVWKQRKYTNKLSTTALFYVMVTNTTSEGVLNSTEYSCHPVFRCKKCDKDSNTRDCCMIYVDENGRVYQNWESYIRENVLPAGTMVTPRRGVYNFNEFGEVILDAYCTPNGTNDAKIMEKAQTSSAVLGLGASCVPVAALVLPVAAPIVVTASIIGVCVGAFTTVTSVRNLRDRKKHDQSISVRNCEARGSYIGVLGGTIGIAAAGATRALSSVAAAGKATKTIEVLVNGLNLSSIALSGTGVVHGVFDLIFKYNDGEDISTMDFLQLSASLVLFTHSVNNFRLASHIANNARNNTIKSHRETLSNRQRKMFDKMSKETMRIRGAAQGRMDIIRGINEIPDRQYLNDLFKINKKLNQQNVRPSFGASGDILLNNEVAVKTAELRQNVQHQMKQVTQPIPSTHNTDSTKVPQDIKIFFANGNVGHSVDVNLNENMESSLKDLAITLDSGVRFFFKIYGPEFLRSIQDRSKFQDIMSLLFEKMEKDVVVAILKLTQSFIEDFKESIDLRIKASISTESVIYHILKHVLNLTASQINRRCKEILSDIKKDFLKYDTDDKYGDKYKCEDCNGIITLSEL